MSQIETVFADRPAELRLGWLFFWFRDGCDGIAGRRKLTQSHAVAILKTFREYNLACQVVSCE